MSLDIIQELSESQPASSAENKRVIQFTKWTYTPGAAPSNDLNVQCIFIMARCEDLYINDDPLLGLVWRNRGEKSTWCVNMSVHRGLYLKAIEHMFGRRNRVKKATRIHCIVRPEFKFVGNVSFSSVDGKEQKSNVPAPLYRVLLRFTHMKICEVWRVELTKKQTAPKLYVAIKGTDDDEGNSTNTSSQYRKAPYACPLCFACVNVSSNRDQHFKTDDHSGYWKYAEKKNKTVPKDQFMLYHFQYCIYCDEYIRGLPTGLLLPVKKDSMTYDTTGMTGATFKKFEQNVNAHIKTNRHIQNVERHNKARKSKNVDRHNKARESTSIQLEPLNKFNHGKRLVRLIRDRYPESFKTYMDQTLQESHMIDIVLRARISIDFYKDPEFVDKYINFHIPERYYEFFEKKGDYSNTYGKYKPGFYRSDQTRYHAELLDRRSKREEWLNLAQRTYWFPCNQDRDDAYGFALYLSIHNQHSRELLEANRMSTRYYSNYTKERELYKKFALFRNHYMLSSNKTYAAYMAAMLFAFRVIYDKGKDAAGHIRNFSAKRKEMARRIKIYRDFEEDMHGEGSNHMLKLFLLDQKFFYTLNEKKSPEDCIYPNYSSIVKLRDSIAELDGKIKTSKQKVETLQQEVGTLIMPGVSELINELLGSDHESNPEHVSGLAKSIKDKLENDWNQSLEYIKKLNKSISSLRYDTYIPNISLDYPFNSQRREDEISEKTKQIEMLTKKNDRTWRIMHECEDIVKNIKQRESHKRELEKNEIHTHVQKLIDMKVSDFLVIFDATMGWTRFTPNRSELNKTTHVIDEITYWAQLIQDDLDSKYEVLDNFDLDQIIKEIKDKNYNALTKLTRGDLVGDRKKPYAHKFLTELSKSISKWSKKIESWSEYIGGMDIKRKISGHAEYLQELKKSVDKFLVAPGNRNRSNDLVKEDIEMSMGLWEESTRDLKNSIEVFKQEDEKRFHMIIIQFARHFRGKSSSTKKAV